MRVCQSFLTDPLFCFTALAIHDKDSIAEYRRTQPPAIGYPAEKEDSRLLALRKGNWYRLCGRKHFMTEI